MVDAAFSAKLSWKATPAHGEVGIGWKETACTLHKLIVDALQNVSQEKLKRKLSIVDHLPKIWIHDIQLATY